MQIQAVFDLLLSGCRKKKWNEPNRKHKNKILFSVHAIHWWYGQYHYFVFVRCFLSSFGCFFIFSHEKSEKGEKKKYIYSYTHIHAERETDLKICYVLTIKETTERKRESKKKRTPNRDAAKCKGLQPTRVNREHRSNNGLSTTCKQTSSNGLTLQHFFRGG